MEPGKKRVFLFCLVTFQKKTPNETPPTSYVIADPLPADAR
jgi:hypothetical protein